MMAPTLRPVSTHFPSPETLVSSSSTCIECTAINSSERPFSTKCLDNNIHNSDAVFLSSLSDEKFNVK